MKRSGIWMISVIVLSLLAACRGGFNAPSPSSDALTPPAPAATPATASPLACRLVTRVEIEAATTHTFVEGRYKPGSMGGVCTFEQYQPQPWDPADSVYVFPFSGAVMFDALRGYGAQELDEPGLGDRAFASPNQIVVLKGDRGFSIVWDRATDVPSMSGEERQERLISLARTAAGRL